jgi:hypothetical protein
VLRDNFGQRIGTREERILVEGAFDGLRVSSLILADAVEPLKAGEPREEEPFALGSVRVAPNPAQTFVRGDPMVVYFQAYGLDLSEGQSSVRVEYAFFREGQPLWKPTEVTLAPTGESERAIFTSFDSARFPPGRYTLAVKVHDLVRAQSSSRESSFRIQE